MATLLDELRVKFTMSQSKLGFVKKQERSYSYARIVKCLFRQLLLGLEYLHRNDIIHRCVALIHVQISAISKLTSCAGT